jgi:hypothetical protein
MVLIARDIAGHTAAYFAWRMGEPVPDGLALAVLIPRALYLVRGRRCAPDEPFWEASSLYLGFRHCAWHFGGRPESRNFLCCGGRNSGGGAFTGERGARRCRDSASYQLTTVHLPCLPCAILTSRVAS